MNDYVNIFIELHKQQVKYLLCGGLAVNIYGIPRMTADIDIILAFSLDNVTRFEKVIKQFNYQSVLPFAIHSLVDLSFKKAMVGEKNLIAYSYFNTQANRMAMDVLVDVPLMFEELWGKRTIRKLGEVEIQMVSVEDLIALKKYSNRKQDQEDVILLSKILK
jgi:predicted nucleotidyltransferase